MNLHNTMIGQKRCYPYEPSECRDLITNGRVVESASKGLKISVKGDSVAPDWEKASSDSHDDEESAEDDKDAGGKDKECKDHNTEGLPTVSLPSEPKKELKKIVESERARVWRIFNTSVAPFVGGERILVLASSAPQSQSVVSNGKKKRKAFRKGFYKHLATFAQKGLVAIANVNGEIFPNSNRDPRLTVLMAYATKVFAKAAFDELQRASSTFEAGNISEAITLATFDKLGVGFPKLSNPNGQYSKNHENYYMQGRILHVESLVASVVTYSELKDAYQTSIGDSELCNDEYSNYPKSQPVSELTLMEQSQSSPMDIESGVSHTGSEQSPNHMQSGLSSGVEIPQKEALDATYDPEASTQFYNASEWSKSVLVNYDPLESLPAIGGPTRDQIRDRNERSLVGPVVTETRLRDLSLPERILQTRYWGRTALEELVKCPICTHDGHMEDTCPARTCVHCGLIDQHFAEACPKNKKCVKCRERGHGVNECTSKLSRSVADGFSCDYCQESHPEECCSWVWRTFNPDRTPLLTKVSNLNVSCYECGSDRHFGGDCPSAPRDRVTTNNTFSWKFASNFSLNLPPVNVSRHSVGGRGRGREIDHPEEFSEASSFSAKKVVARPPQAEIRIKGISGLNKQNNRIHQTPNPQMGLRTRSDANKISHGMSGITHMQPPLPDEPLPEPSQWHRHVR